nr:bifunctional adenosylcobinamide kinase/adenosylcobinamide-phosphate guanylyltransferase [Thalassococcus sp. S3]
MLPARTLVLGGAASGKSAYAESLAEIARKSKAYIATAQAFDDEMRAKIDRHQTARGSGWHTIEEPFDLATALSQAPEDGVVLLDCATLWLSNHLLAEHDLQKEQDKLLDALLGADQPIIVVSNEVGHGVVPENRLARRFRDAQGQLNIALAAQCDLVVQVVAGLPRALKGSLP